MVSYDIPQTAATEEIGEDRRRREQVRKAGGTCIEYYTLDIKLKNGGCRVGRCVGRCMAATGVTPHGSGWSGAPPAPISQRMAIVTEG